MAASRHVIRPARMADVYQLAANMRIADACEAIALGMSPKRMLRASLKSSLLAWSGFVDGSIAAMWGMGGDILSEIGEPWLLTTAAIEKVPVTFVKEARKTLAAMLEIKPILMNYVAADYTAAVRFLEILGFTLAPAAPLGPKGALFRQFFLEAM